MLRAVSGGAGGGGTVTVTGSPSNGNLTKFSGATSITNGNLSGDVTTTNTLTTTVAAIAGTTVSGTTGSTNVVFSSAPTLTNPVVGTQATSDNSTKAASTAYVTTAISNALAGVNPAVAVQAATTQASDTSGLTYNNGVSGVGATLTGVANTALTIDGYTFTAVGQRLLVKNDTQSPSGAFNGVYYVTQIQTAILPIILTRALDYNQPSDINNTGAIPVISGTANTDTSWLLTSQVTTVGTDALTYTQFTKNPANLLTTTLTSAHLLVGNGSNIATDVAITGDVTITNAGVTAVKSSLALAGSPTTTTQSAGDNSTKIATTAYVYDAVNNIVINTQANDYTLVLTDNGKFVDMTKGTATVLTIPANASVAFPVGTQITIRQGGAGQVTVAITTDTLNNPQATLKTRVQYSQFVITKMASTTWTIIGDAALS